MKDNSTGYFIMSHYHRFACWAASATMFIGGVFDDNHDENLFMCATIMLAVSCIVDAMHYSRKAE